MEADSHRNLITWESFTFLYIMAAFTWLGLTILRAGVDSYSSWHAQMESIASVRRIRRVHDD